MLRLFFGPVPPGPDDLCLVHSPASSSLSFRRGPSGDWWVPRHRLPPADDPGLFLGETDQGIALWALEEPAEDNDSWTPLRGVLAEAEPDQLKAAVRAAELAAWRKDHRFCGACGTPTRRRTDQLAIECPACHAEFWPRVTPAVIMLVHRGDEVLLARNGRFNRPIFSCLAGFVETGETLEDAVAREVAEEVSVEVGTPVYQGSQAWPFPHALMTGFLVPWVAGEPVPDGHEIVEAGWYRRDNLPELPPPLSIARSLIRRFFQDPTL